MTFEPLKKIALPFLVLMIILVIVFEQISSIHSKPSNLQAGEKVTDPAATNDSAEVLNLLKSVYQWHARNQNNFIDFDIIVKDSFQTGLDYNSFNKVFSALQQTNYFSTSFMNNYKKIADYINYKLTTANPKYLNEINFPSQEADPWTGFQDDFPEFWNKFKIADYRQTKDYTSLTWRVQNNGWTSDKYAVGFLKENGKWKVAYLTGFEFASYKK